jgi:hypothetical protein
MEQLTPHTQMVAADEDSIRMIARADLTWLGSAPKTG